MAKGREMHILIDIGHPAHVHFYRYLIKSANRKHKITVVARDKEVTADLLDSLGIDYIDRGTGGGSSLSKCFYLIKVVLKLMKLIWQNDVDVVTGIGNPYVALAGFFTHRPSIIFNDTEHAATTVRILRIFASVILTPVSYLTSAGNQQLRYAGFHEMAYLHPNQFTPNPEALEALGLNTGEKYVIVRFVAWDATHDIGHAGLSYAAKRNIVKTLAKSAKVFISSEKPLPKEFEAFQLNVSPDKMHNVLANADLFVGEGATMASECAVLGTPAIYVNSLELGYINEQQEYGLVFYFRNSDGVIEKAIEILTNPTVKEEWQKRRHAMLSDKIDVATFMVWFIENYPESSQTIRKSPDFFKQFRHSEQKVTQVVSSEPESQFVDEV